MYQAELYQKAQETIQTKEDFLKNIVNETMKMLENIMELSEAMSKTEEQCENHIKCLNHISKIANNFLDFVNKIKKNMFLPKYEE